MGCTSCFGVTGGAEKPLPRAEKNKDGADMTGADEAKPDKAVAGGRVAECKNVFYKSAAFRAALAIMTGGAAVCAAVALLGGSGGGATAVTVPPHMDFSGGGYATLGRQAAGEAQNSSTFPVAGVNQPADFENMESSSGCVGVLPCRARPETPDSMPQVSLSGAEDYAFSKP